MWGGMACSQAANGWAMRQLWRVMAVCLFGLSLGEIPRESRLSQLSQGGLGQIPSTSAARKLGPCPSLGAASCLQAKQRAGDVTVRLSLVDHETWKLLAGPAMLDRLVPGFSSNCCILLGPSRTLPLAPHRTACAWVSG